MTTTAMLLNRLQRIEERAHVGAVTLGDGSTFVPRIPPLEMLIDLMEGPEFAPEVQAEAVCWAKYEPKPSDPPFLSHIVTMARELVK